jgi:hypothetical protein
MSDFNSAGYDDLRQYVTSASGWSHIALVDDSGNEETRIDIANDSRASWGDASTNPVTLTVDISGGDSDISTPVELSKSELHTGSGTTTPAHGDQLTDSNGDTANAIVGANDSLTVEHTVELPNV